MEGAGWGDRNPPKYSSDVCGKEMLRGPRREAVHPFAWPTGTQTAWIAGVCSVLGQEEEKQRVGSSVWPFSLKGHWACLDTLQSCAHQTKQLSTPLTLPDGFFCLLSLHLASQLPLWAHQDFSLKTQSDHRVESWGKRADPYRVLLMPNPVCPVLTITRNNVAVLGPGWII